MNTPSRSRAPWVDDPSTVEVVVEIPKGARNKYEYDHDREVLFLDRHLFTATVYPAEYGFIPHTLAEDGDPLDALVILDEPTFPGCHIRARPLGVFWMSDEHGPDAKIICVPANRLGAEPAGDLTDVDRDQLREIAHFFKVYKDLEPDKQTDVGDFDGASAAWEEIRRSVDRAGEA